MYLKNSVFFNLEKIDTSEHKILLKRNTRGKHGINVEPMK